MTTQQVATKLNLTESVINYRCRKLNIDNFVGKKRVFNDYQISKIKKIRSKQRIKEDRKFSKEKIHIVDFFIQCKNKNLVEISSKMGLNYTFVSNTISEYLKNNKTITVQSKMNYDN